jgi:hypothetical protein
MIYQTNNFMNKTQKSRFKNQEGVTILLAILILGSILAISFSLASILFIEVRDSGDLLKTEPALYAATGIGEQAFFNLERSACPSGTIDCYQTQFPNHVLNVGTPTVVASTTPIFTVRVKTGTTFNTTLNDYYFCTAGSGGCGYGKVTISYVVTNGGSDALKTYLCQYDPAGSYPTTPCSAEGTGQGYWDSPDAGVLNADGSITMTPLANSSESWTLNPALRQQLILTNPAGAADIFVKIQTYDTDDVTGKGLPFVGKTVININTLNGSVSRKIQVSVPN